MRVIEIKLSWFARYITKPACCSVLKDQWLRIVMSLVISIMWIKPVKFDSRTAEARVSLVCFGIEKLHILRAISVFGPSFLLLLGPPFTTWYNDLTFFETQKSALGAPSDNCRKKGYPKSETAWVDNFWLGPDFKKVGGALLLLWSESRVLIRQFELSKFSRRPAVDCDYLFS